MDMLHALILGIVEGLTEFIPVSSTGHMILVSHAMGFDQPGPMKDAVDAFEVVIQAGALLACLLYYAPLLILRVRGLRSDDPVQKQQSKRLFLAMAIAFVPIAVIGKLFAKPIKAALFHPIPVAIALIVGGVLMIAMEGWAKQRSEGKTLADLRLPQALTVGLAQCAALIPGTSRSMATILGGLAAGLDMRAAADFSFLVSLPVLGAATAYQLLKERQTLMEHIGLLPMTVGLIAAFIVGLASIAGFLQLLTRFGLRPWGIYRIVLGIAVAIALGT
jgi:undecaprenyl-diphosphatase